MKKDEILQAINAGEVMIECLNKALKYAIKARRWGVVDMIFKSSSGWTKYNKLAEAEKYINQAKMYADRLSVGHKRIEVFLPSINISHENLDVIADSFAVDYIVQEDVASCEYAIRESIEDVTRVINDLKNKLEAAEE